MQEIHRAKVYALYNQVALYDAEDKEAYPQWETGKEKAVWGPRGVAVATAGDVEVEVIVLEGKGHPGGTFCAAGKIQVGNEGVLVGNEISTDIAKLDWPPGTTQVRIYLAGPSGKAMQVMFVLERLR